MGNTTNIIIAIIAILGILAYSNVIEFNSADEINNIPSRNENPISEPVPEPVDVPVDVPVDFPVDFPVDIPELIVDFHTASINDRRTYIGDTPKTTDNDSDDVVCDIVGESNDGVIHGHNHGVHFGQEDNYRCNIEVVRWGINSWTLSDIQSIKLQYSDFDTKSYVFDDLANNKAEIRAKLVGEGNDCMVDRFYSTPKYLNEIDNTWTLVASDWTPLDSMNANGEVIFNDSLKEMLTNQVNKDYLCLAFSQAGQSIGSVHEDEVGQEIHMRWKIKDPKIVINRLEIVEPEDDNKDIEKQELDLVCTNRKECIEMLGAVGNGIDARRNAAGKSVNAQICGLYIADLTSQLNLEDSNDLAIMFQGGSVLVDLFENHVLLMDNNVESLSIKRTSSTPNMNAQYCVEGSIKLACVINCISGDINRGSWDLVINPTSLKHTGGCQKYINEHKLDFPSAVAYQLIQRHCLV